MAKAASKLFKEHFSLQRFNLILSVPLFNLGREEDEVDARYNENIIEFFRLKL